MKKIELKVNSHSINGKANNHIRLWWQFFLLWTFKHESYHRKRIKTPCTLISHTWYLILARIYGIEIFKNVTAIFVHIGFLIFLACFQVHDENFIRWSSSAYPAKGAPAKYRIKLKNMGSSLQFYCNTIKQWAKKNLCHRSIHCINVKLKSKIISHFKLW